MILYGYFRSSAAYRCRIACNLLGVSPEMRSIHLVRNGGEQKSELFTRINPQQLVPALEVDGQIITQSLAIIEYLNEIHNGNLLGDDAMMRSQIRAFSQIIACDIHPLQNLRVLQYIAHEFGQKQQTQKEKWCQKWLGDGLQACEAMATKQQHDGDFVFGKQPSLADICLIPQIFSAYRFQVDMKLYPRLLEIYKKTQEIQSFTDAVPEKQPDAE